MPSFQARQAGLAAVVLLSAALAVRAQPTTAPAAAAKPTTRTEQCASADCHASIVARKVLHGPVAQKKCQACHLYDEPREHRFKLAGAPPGAKLCESCHTMNLRTFVHKPLADGKCTDCHDPHGSDFASMLVADPVKGLCQKCHAADAWARKKFLHGPVAAGACILCHEPHSAWQAKLLVKTKDKLCLDCHGEVIRQAEEDRYVHKPVREDCSLCHDPHASDIKFQLRQPAQVLCTSCHAEIKKELAGAKTVHGPAADPAGCGGCHEPHSSKLEKLQKAPQPQACLNCHNKPLKATDGSELTDMARLLKDNPEHHGPIREGSCTACHQPHAAGHFRLLSQDYPPEFYAPFQIERYALCFNCHLPQLVLQPNGVGLTRFRDGERNLHFLHVNREKGRTCRACHEVHASKHPFHIRDSVPFGSGGWLLEIGYKQTPTGGSCTPGCHREQKYDRGDDREMQNAK